MTTDATSPRSRRALLTAAAGGAAAAAAATLAKASPVAAEGETIKVGGEYATATSRTFLKNSTTDADVLVVTTNGGGKAVWGKSTDGVGVRAESVNNIGLEATGKNHGVRGRSTGGSGVRAESVTGTGLHAIGGDTGVQGSGSHTGVSGSGGLVGVRGRTSRGVGVLAEAVGGQARALEADGRIAFDKVSGVATIPAGRTSVTIDPGVVVENGSFVLLTPRTNIGGRGLWYVPNTTADTFRIRVSSTSTKPIKVAWLLVG